MFPLIGIIIGGINTQAMEFLGVEVFGFRLQGYCAPV